MDKLLNWDHEVTPTSVEDLFLNLCDHIKKFTGREVRINVKNNRILNIELHVPSRVETKLYDGYQGVEFLDVIKHNAYWETAVALDLYNYGREICGRGHHIGINSYRVSTYVDNALRH